MTFLWARRLLTVIPQGLAGCLGQEEVAFPGWVAESALSPAAVGLFSLEKRPPGAPKVLKKLQCILKIHIIVHKDGEREAGLRQESAARREAVPQPAAGRVRPPADPPPLPPTSGRAV